LKLFGFEIEKRTIIFLLIFSVVGLFLYQIKFSEILGVQSQNFTLFQFIGPIGAGIAGSAFGVVSVLIVESMNFLVNGKAPELLTFVRFLPMMLAALYFGQKGKSSAVIAAICMVAFWASPVGLQVWYYPLYWLIPIGASFFKGNIFVRSLGATFTAHAVGSVIFLYAFAIPAPVWASLIPIVAIERLTFAGGITASYYAMNTILDALSSKARIDLGFLNIDKKYSLIAAPAPKQE